jgi:hypothetical protein
VSKVNQTRSSKKKIEMDVRSKIIVDAIKKFSAGVQKIETQNKND